MTTRRASNTHRFTYNKSLVAHSIFVTKKISRFLKKIKERLIFFALFENKFVFLHHQKTGYGIQQYHWSR